LSSIITIVVVQHYHYRRRPILPLSSSSVVTVVVVVRNCTLQRRTGTRRVVRLLSEECADSAARDESKWTALHLAAKNRHEAVVLLLQEKGSNASAIDISEQTALHLAAENGARDSGAATIGEGSQLSREQIWMDGAAIGGSKRVQCADATADGEGCRHGYEGHPGGQRCTWRQITDMRSWWCCCWRRGPMQPRGTHLDGQLCMEWH
jgi:hypothetical protein